MAISNTDKKILQEIVDSDGDCLKVSRCKQCPFRSMCLPEFLFPKPLTKDQRLKMAVDVLVHHSLIDEDCDIQDILKK